MPMLYTLEGDWGIFNFARPSRWDDTAKKVSTVVPIASAGLVMAQSVYNGFTSKKTSGGSSSPPVGGTGYNPGDNIPSAVPTAKKSPAGLLVIGGAAIALLMAALD